MTTTNATREQEAQGDAPEPETAEVLAAYAAGWRPTNVLLSTTGEVVITEVNPEVTSR